MQETQFNAPQSTVESPPPFLMELEYELDKEVCKLYDNSNALYSAAERIRPFDPFPMDGSTVSPEPQLKSHYERLEKAIRKIKEINRTLTTTVDHLHRTI